VGERTKVDADGKAQTVTRYAGCHDLRRSFGERWSGRVMPQVLMELMRHESMQTTLTFYVGKNAQRTADAVWAAFEAHEQKGNTSGNSGEIVHNVNDSQPSQSAIR
jgi:integrase